MVLLSMNQNDRMKPQVTFLHEAQETNYLSLSPQTILTLSLFSLWIHSFFTIKHAYPSIICQHFYTTNSRSAVGKLLPLLRTNLSHTCMAHSRHLLLSFFTICICIFHLFIYIFIYYLLNFFFIACTLICFLILRCFPSPGLWYLLFYLPLCSFSLCCYISSAFSPPPCLLNISSTYSQMLLHFLVLFSEKVLLFSDCFSHPNCCTFKFAVNFLRWH